MEEETRDSLFFSRWNSFINKKAELSTCQGQLTHGSQLLFQTGILKIQELFIEFIQSMSRDTLNKFQAQILMFINTLVSQGFLTFNQVVPLVCMIKGDLH